MAIRKGIKIIAENRKAFHDYFIDEKFEAGIVLSGTEVKSLRAGKVNLKDSYVQVKEGEIFLIGVHISPYEQGNRFNVDPLRDRKLLLHKQEIRKLTGKLTLQGMTLIPLKMYINEDGRAKIELGLCRGKKNYDKREAIAKKDAQRSMERSMRNH